MLPSEQLCRLWKHWDTPLLHLDQAWTLSWPSWFGPSSGCTCWPGTPSHPPLRQIFQHDQDRIGSWNVTERYACLFKKILFYVDVIVLMLLLFIDIIKTHCCWYFPNRSSGRRHPHFQGWHILNSRLNIFETFFQKVRIMKTCVNIQNASILWYKEFVDNETKWVFEWQSLVI